VYSSVVDDDDNDYVWKRWTMLMIDDDDSVTPYYSQEKMKPRDIKSLTARTVLPLSA
jgi:hypothetical protein